MRPRMLLTNSKRLDLMEQSYKRAGDLFSVGDLEYDEEKEAHIVKDVAYCIEQANNWKNSAGDYAEDDLDPEKWSFLP